LPPRENYKNVLAAGIKDVPTLEQIVTTLLKQANAGNPQLMGQLADRLDGRVPQTVSDAEGNVLQPVAALIFTDGGQISSPSEADRGDEHEGNGVLYGGAAGGGKSHLSARRRSPGAA